MDISWCPSKYLDLLISLGTVELRKDYIKFIYKGINFNFRAKDEVEIFTEVFLTKEYEVPLKKESVIIDIGANIGIATLYFANDDNVAKVYSYEPFKLTFKCLKDNVNENPILSKKIQLNNFAMGKVDRVSKGIINDLLKGNSKISSGDEAPPSYEGHPGEYIVEEVQMRRAATVINKIIDENLNSDIIIKMDCEGGEEEIFSDEEFVNLLSNITGIVMETHSREGLIKIAEILKERNFHIICAMLTQCNGYIKAFKI